MAVTASIVVEGPPDPRSLISLLGWLERDHDLRRLASVTSGTRQGADEWQNAVDIIDLVLSNAIAVGSLVVAFRSWRQTQSKAPPITVIVNGVSVTIPDASPESLEILEKALRAALPPGDDAA